MKYNVCAALFKRMCSNKCIPRGCNCFTKVDYFEGFRVCQLQQTNMAHNNENMVEIVCLRCVHTVCVALSDAGTVNHQN